MVTLISPSATPVKNTIHPNNGNGTFGAGINFGTGSDGTGSVAWGDFDGDGDLDLAVGNSEQQNVIHLNNGDGTFGSSINVGPDSGDTTVVAWGDFDGDGDLDLATANNGGQNVVYRNVPPALTVNKTGSVGGTITSLPVGIACGITTAEFTYGTMVTLTATATSGATLAAGPARQWNGPLYGHDEGHAGGHRAPSRPTASPQR